MKKTLMIAWKDLKIIFRDRAALILMLAAPFALTLGLGFVTGRFSGGDDGNTGLRDIPVHIVNQDQAALGAALVQIFASAEVAELVEPTMDADVAGARRAVDDNQAAAALIIPAGFTGSVIPNDASGRTEVPGSIELYVNPARPLSAGVVRAVVDGFLHEVETGRVSGQVAVAQLLERGLIAPQDAPRIGQEIGTGLRARQPGDTLITIRRNNADIADASSDFDTLAVFAPGMAMLFLMYTVSLGGRSILAERDQGTLARMLSTPTPIAQILGGKVFGIFLTGFAQLGILILASSLLFRLPWGDPVAVLALVLAIVAAATGWGIVIAAMARTPAQVASVGAALMPLFGILSGSFIPVAALPAWLQAASKLTPNAWGLEGFVTLGRGGTLGDIVRPISALLLMGGLLFIVAVVVFQRRGVVQR